MSKSYIVPKPTIVSPELPETSLQATILPLGEKTLCWFSLLEANWRLAFIQLPGGPRSCLAQQTHIDWRWEYRERHGNIRWLHFRTASTPSERAYKYFSIQCLRSEKSLPHGYILNFPRRFFSRPQNGCAVFLPCPTGGMHCVSFFAHTKQHCHCPHKSPTEPFYRLEGFHLKIVNSPTHDFK